MMMIVADDGGCDDSDDSADAAGLKTACFVKPNHFILRRYSTTISDFALCLPPLGKGPVRPCPISSICRLFPLWLVRSCCLSS